jgi:ATP-dependent RNA helicase DDX23/PRP28
MGFEPQVITVLEAMGGLLKSEDEEQAEQQVKTTQEGKTLYRVTAMFSATMPPQVEQIARTYLRHPVLIRIGLFFLLLFFFSCLYCFFIFTVHFSLLS